ncbi:MAG: hypothetical protein ACI31R_02725 [Bacilli bacterium]
MIRRKRDDGINREYLYYLMNDVGLLNDYELDEIGISFDEYDDPDDDVLEKIEDYRDKKRGC